LSHNRTPVRKILACRFVDLDWPRKGRKKTAFGGDSALRTKNLSKNVRPNLSIGIELLIDCNMRGENRPVISLNLLKY